MEKINSGYFFCKIIFNTFFIAFCKVLINSILAGILVLIQGTKMAFKKLSTYHR